MQQAHSAAMLTGYLRGSARECCISELTREGGSMSATISRDFIETALDNVGGDWDYDDIREGYSGRGMSGSECLGIVFRDARDVFAFFVELAAEHYDTAELLARKAREDSMGLGVIVYFPGVTVGDESASRTRGGCPG